jgi:predicted outer membrane protein
LIDGKTTTFLTLVFDQKPNIPSTRNYSDRFAVQIYRSFNVRSLRIKFFCAAITAVLIVPAMVYAQTERPQDPSRVQDPARRPTQGDQQTLTTYLASKLYLANHMEIKLGEIAAQKANNAEVKQLAQTIVQEHQQLNQKLKPFLPPEAVEKIDNMSGPASGAGSRPGDNRNDPTSAQRRENRGDGQDQRNQQGQQDPRNQQGRTGGQPMQGNADSFMKQLCEIEHQAAKKHMQMTSEMLQRQQGQDFDMAFLGLQIGAHTWLVAELEAIESVGQDDFQSVTKLALEASRDHKEKAQQLAQRLEDNEDGNNRSSDREDDRDDDDDGGR